MKLALRLLPILCIILGFGGYFMGGLASVLSCVDACTDASPRIIGVAYGIALAPYVILTLVCYFLFLRAARHVVPTILYYGVLALLPVVLVFITVVTINTLISVDAHDALGRAFDIVEPSLICSAMLPLAIFIGAFFLPQSAQPTAGLSTP